jgi:hypothetical protein
MKKIIVVMMAATVAISACAQKVNESQVSQAAKTAFQKNYSGVKGSWDKEGASYEVSFKKDGKTMSLLITATGSIQETETEIPVSDLPAVIQSYVKEHYKNEKIKEAARLVKGNGEVNYEAEVDDKDVIFDANGKFIKEAKD